MLHQIEQYGQEFCILDPIGMIDRQPLQIAGDPRHPDALGDELPADVFGPEDGAAALQAAEELLDWASDQLP